MELLDKLGIHFGLLVAQIINFLILLFVLYKFLYKPVLNLLKKREKIIAQSIEDADAIDKKLKEMEIRYDEKIAKAKKQAMMILEESEKQSAMQKKESIKKTKKEVAGIINGAKKQIAEEKEKILQEVRGEISELIISAVEKIVGKEREKKIDKKLVEDTVKEL